MTELSSDDFSHIEPDVLESFLRLIRDKYLIVDKANYVLEETGANGISIAVFNQRDFISHLCSVIRNKHLNREGQLAQLSAGEEHLRRAIIESYQTALEMKIATFSESYDNFRLHGMLKNSSESLSVFDHIKRELDEVKDYRKKGRTAKSTNDWNSEWEDGVEAFYEAIRKIDDLQTFLNAKYEDKKFKLLMDSRRLIKTWKIIAGILIVVIIILAIALVFQL